MRHCFRACLVASLLAAPAFADDAMSFITHIRRCSASYAGNGSGITFVSRPVPYDPFYGVADLDIDNGLELFLPYSEQTSSMDTTSVQCTSASTVLIVASPLSEPLQSIANSRFDLY